MTTEEQIAFQNGFATGYKIAKGMVFKKKEQSDKLILTYNITSTTLKAFTLIEATNYTVDWGDGTVNSNTDTHVYSTIGTYTISVEFEELYFIRFGNITSLIEVDGKLHSLSTGFDINGCFNRCSSLTSISSYLFDECINVTNFSNIFNGCLSLTSIPSGLFDNCINVTNFSGCFSGCSSLTSIPSGLFDNCINVTSFTNCFNGCLSLILMPEELFDNCTNVFSFEGCFYNCSLLTGNAPTLWERVNVTSYSGCFYECRSLSNYADIPYAWKNY